MGGGCAGYISNTGDVRRDHCESRRQILEQLDRREVVRGVGSIWNQADRGLRKQPGHFVMRNEARDLRADGLELGPAIAVSDDEQRRRAATESAPRVGDGAGAVPRPQATAEHRDGRVITTSSRRGDEASRIGGVRHDLDAARSARLGIPSQRTAHGEHDVCSGKHGGQHASSVIRALEASIHRLLFKQRRIELNQVRDGQMTGGA
jgi:hypothetical protein